MQNRIKKPPRKFEVLKFEVLTDLRGSPKRTSLLYKVNYKNIVFGSLAGSPFSGMPTTFLIGGRLFHYLFDRGGVFNFWMGGFLIRGGFSPPNLNHYVLIRRHYLFDRGVFLISGWFCFSNSGGFSNQGSRLRVYSCVT